MKVNEVVNNMDGLTDSALVKFLDKREDEVFTLSELSEKLNCNKIKLRSQLAKLINNESIDRYIIHKAKHLYGSKKSIKSLEDSIHERQKRF